MKKLHNFILLLSLTVIFISCSKDPCQDCFKTIGGIAGTDTVETREVCDEDDAENLEASSSGTTVWDCENE